MVNNSVSWGRKAGVEIVGVAEKVLTKKYILNSKEFFITPTPENTPEEKRKRRQSNNGVGRSIVL